MDLDKQDLDRLFDQMAPSQQQEDAVLARLLAPKQEGKRPMRQIRKTALALAAAAALLTTCAFAAYTLDPRLLSFFRYTQQDAELVADGVVEVNQSHTYENGWTVEVKQLLADRYVLTALVEVIAPEDEPLPAGLSSLTLHLEDPQADDPTPSVGGSRLLEDGDPEDNRYTFLCFRSPAPASAAQGTVPPSSISITPLDLWSDTSDGPVIDFRGDDWCCTAALPGQDSGREFQAGQAVQVEEEQVTVTQLYLSPISTVIRIDGPARSPFLTSLHGLSSLEEKVVLNLEDGSAVPMFRSYSSSYNPDTGTGAFYLQNEQIIDPEQVESITILDQIFPL